MIARRLAEQRERAAASLAPNLAAPAHPSAPARAHAPPEPPRPGPDDLESVVAPMPRFPSPLPPPPLPPTLSLQSGPGVTASAVAGPRLGESMRLSAFRATGDELDQEDATRSLASGAVGRDDDVTRSLASGAVGRDDDAARSLSRSTGEREEDVTLSLSGAHPELHDDDTGVTRPLLPWAPPTTSTLPWATVPQLALEPPTLPRAIVLPPPPVLPPPRIAVAVSVPRRSSGVVEQSPSVQIRAVAPLAPAAPEVPVVMGDFSPRAPGTGASLWSIALAAIAVAATIVAVALWPRRGSVVVTVSGPDGRAVHGVSILVDGSERCASTPCEVADLLAGAHLVSAGASGLATSAVRAFVVEAGERAAQHVTLSEVERSPATLDVTAVGDGLRVFVDGRDVGAPPVSLDSVEPGQHTVRVVGADRYYEPYEDSVHLRRGENRSVGPVRLRVVRGRLQLLAGEGAEGAVVAVDGRRVARLPAALDLSPGEPHEITATRAGYEGFSRQIVFEEVAEQAVEVRLAPSVESAGPPVAVSRGHRSAPNPPARTTASPAARRAAPAGRASAPAATGAGTLDLSSTPPARVVVNGRPVGTTPLRGVRVDPGPQTIVFVHPALGRKIASTRIAPGGRAAVSVKF